jgi:hypothetical protein
LPKSCHSLNLGTENFASFLSGGYGRPPPYQCPDMIAYFSFPEIQKSSFPAPGVGRFTPENWKTGKLAC